MSHSIIIQGPDGVVGNRRTSDRREVEAAIEWINAALDKWELNRHSRPSVGKMGTPRNV